MIYEGAVPGSPASDVTVITATLPEREVMLSNAMASVRAQQLQPAAHLIGVDFARRGGARMKTLLASAVTTDFLAILDDDDLFYPDHLAALREAIDGFDVAYSYCDVKGPDPWLAYNRPFDPDALRRTSVVSHNALVRTELVLDMGGWPDVKGYDWHFWVAALDRGARFTSVPKVTWNYNLERGMWHESRPWLAAS